MGDRRRSAETLELCELREREERPGLRAIELVTNDGAIDTRLHAAPGASAAVLWVFGAGGGLGGPAGGIYVHLAEVLAPEGITSLRLDYRRPGELASSVMDVLMGIAFLEHLGHERVLLVGHSFGGAVVIAAGVSSPRVAAVAALSSQTHGTSSVAQLAPRPLLLVHGTNDEVLPDRCSKEIYARALEPKQLILYPGCAHGLDACRAALERDLGGWIRAVLSEEAHAPAT